MATTPVDYALLAAESWWAREFAPPNLQAFYLGLRTYLDRGANAVGGKGDNRHRYGYHRSREWVLNSAYSVYHAADYSVIHPLDQGGDDRWLSALDATPYTVETLIAMCQRLDAAVKADLVPQVREWYGNLDGDEVVDGWDNVRQRAASSDSSHLWHLHISFFRSRADWDHSGLLAILIGDDDMMTPEEYADLLGKTKLPNGETVTTTLVRLLARSPWDLVARLDTLGAAVGELKTILAEAADTTHPTHIDTVTQQRIVDIAAKLEAIPVEVRDAVADFGEGGAVQVRADAE